MLVLSYHDCIHIRSSVGHISTTIPPIDLKTLPFDTFGTFGAFRTFDIFGTFGTLDAVPYNAVAIAASLCHWMAYHGRCWFFHTMIASISDLL